MPSRPTLEELRSRIAADIESDLEGTDALLARSLEAVLTDSLAGLSHEMHGLIEWAMKQIFPETAAREYAIAHAAPYGITPRPAQQAEGEIELTGVDGETSPAGTLWQRADGTVFVQDADATIVAGEANAGVTAQLPGSAGNVAAGVTLSLVSPVSGIAQDAVVASGGISDGVDEESLPSLVYRLLLRRQSQPQGGGIDDYKRWALEVPGVTAAWQIKNWSGPGTVGVMFLVGDAEVPDAGKISEVKAYLETKAPVTAEVIVFAPTLSPVDYTITISPDTVAVREAVEAELFAFHAREADRAVTLFLSRINAAIAGAAGLNHHTLTAPATNQTASANTIRTLGTVTFV